MCFFVYNVLFYYVFVFFIKYNKTYIFFSSEANLLFTLYVCQSVLNGTVENLIFSAAIKEPSKSV